MEQNIKPILWLKVSGGHPTQEEIRVMQNQLQSMAPGYTVIATGDIGNGKENIELQVLSPYKDNGEIPEELLTWLKNQNDGTS